MAEAKLVAEATNDKFKVSLDENCKVKITNLSPDTHIHMPIKDFTKLLERFVLPGGGEDDVVMPRPFMEYLTFEATKYASVRSSLRKLLPELTKHKQNWVVELAALSGAKHAGSRFISRPLPAGASKAEVEEYIKKLKKKVTLQQEALKKQVEEAEALHKARKKTSGGETAGSQASTGHEPIAQDWEVLKGLAIGDSKQPANPALRAALDAHMTESVDLGLLDVSDFEDADKDDASWVDPTEYLDECGPSGSQ